MNQSINKLDKHFNNDDWVTCKTKDNYFLGYGSPMRLNTILDYFFKNFDN